MHWADCSLTIPWLLKYGSVFWELMHWNHIWWLLWSTSRKQLLITTSSHLLHLKYKGKHLSEAGEEAAQQLLLKLHPQHPEVIPYLCAFTAGSDPIPASLLSSTCVDQMLHVVWWTSVSNCKCKVSPPLISTALKLLHLPLSSNFGLVQSKL